jgi:site-specific recombinase XerD
MKPTPVDEKLPMPESTLAASVLDRPIHSPIGPDLVRKTVRQAYARVGLPYTRSHLLRHTMAGRLLAGGASLKEGA